MALIAMAVYSTEENGKDKYLERTLQSLADTIDLPGIHRLILSVNGATKETDRIIDKYRNIIHRVIVNDSNIGTAEAINKVWKERWDGENAIKMDDDVVINQKDWIEDMGEAIRRDPKIGIIGLKRKDLWENPDHPDEFYRSKLRMLSHKPGDKWIVIEEVNHVMGTCQMYSSALLDKLGYLWQPGIYGFDDSFAGIRCSIAGFVSAFLPYIDIDHIDSGDTPFQKWKEKYAGECWEKFHVAKKDFLSGKRKIYYNPFK